MAQVELTEEDALLLFDCMDQCMDWCVGEDLSPILTKALVAFPQIRSNATVVKLIKELDLDGIKEGCEKR